jgi:DNA-directed RNA polymerase subunit M/transcription elongation factor TFIIS
MDDRCPKCGCLMSTITDKYGNKEAHCSACGYSETAH